MDIYDDASFEDEEDGIGLDIIVYNTPIPEIGDQEKALPPLDSRERNEQYNQLKNILLSSACCSEKNTTDFEKEIKILTEQQINEILLSHIPDIENIFDRTQSIPISSLIVSTYSNGIPAYDSQPVLQIHITNALHFIFDRFIHMSPSVAKKHLTRLCDAFRSCQAEQGRVIDAIYGQLKGRDRSFKDQVLAIVDEQKERVLEHVVNTLNPNAWKQDDSIPQKQVPHILSSYRLAVGPNLGLRGVKAASTDRNAFRIDDHQRGIIKKSFFRLFLIYDLIQTLISDVNQQEKDAERVIDRDELARWAGNTSENYNFPSHSIYYSEERDKIAYHGQIPKDENKFQPFLCHDVALNILMHLFVKKS